MNAGALTSASSLEAEQGWGRRARGKVGVDRRDDLVTGDAEVITNTLNKQHIEVNVLCTQTKMDCTSSVHLRFHCQGRKKQTRNRVPAKNS